MRTIHLPPKAHYPSIQAMVAAAINRHWQNFQCSDPDKIFSSVVAHFENEERAARQRINNDTPLLVMLGDSGQDDLKLLVRKIRWILTKGEDFIRHKIKSYLLNRMKARSIT